MVRPRELSGVVTYRIDGLDGGVITATAHKRWSYKGPICGNRLRFAGPNGLDVLLDPRRLTRVDKGHLAYRT